MCEICGANKMLALFLAGRRTQMVTENIPGNTWIKRYIKRKASVSMKKQTDALKNEQDP